MNTSGLTFLIAEDQDFQRTMLRMLLGAWGRSRCTRPPTAAKG